MTALCDRYADRVGEGLIFELDFSRNDSITTSDLLITDWSGIAPEFCFSTGRPALFINTKIKCLNPNWENLGLTPVEISLRNEIGVSLNPDELDRVRDTVAELIENTPTYRERIDARFATLIYNHGHAGEAGARYILSSLMKKREKKA